MPAMMAKMSPVHAHIKLSKTGNQQPADDRIKDKHPAAMTSRAMSR